MGYSSDSSNQEKEASGLPEAGKGVPADAEVRSRVLDPGESFHLEAPAGSGKTFLLTARFLRLLGNVDHPQQILALTFTNKAAGEMNERVGRYLRRAKDGQQPEDELDSQLLDSAKKALKRHSACRDLLLGGELLRIQTFHSFCFSIVSQAPLEAGIVPGSSLLVEQEQLFFLREVIDQTLLEIMNREPEDSCRKALENRLLYLNNSWPQLVREIEELMQRREALSELLQVLRHHGGSEFLLKGIRELVEVELGSLKKAFNPSLLAASWPEFLKALESKGASAASELPGEVPESLWENLPSWRLMADTFLTKSGEPRKRFGPSTGFYSGFAKTEWASFIQSMPASAAERFSRIRELPFLEDALPDLDTLSDLSLLLLTVLQQYQERCRRQRKLDFTDLEKAALRLFNSTEPSDLQLLLDQQIRHILIDEFQDTNYQQWELLRGLCAEWESGDGRTLFLVGDPKQSIYSFRKADVQLFMQAASGLPLDEFRTLRLESRALNTNFRSFPHLIEWSNSLFEQTIMLSPKRDLDEVEFSRSVASPKTKPPESPPAPELSLFFTYPDSESARRREAGWLAHSIERELMDGASSNSRIGILLFTRAHLPIYLEALQSRGIPVRVAEGLKLPERPEVRYLYQLCRALVFPHDHLAWASQLHSPWLFLNYRDILALSREEPEPWIEKIRSYAAKNERVASFWESLRSARRHIGHEPLSDVIEEAWLALGGARIAAARWGSRGIACCRQFFDLVRQAEVHEPVQTLTHLDQLLENAFEPIDPDTATSAVSVMTVHKAKGLEFDTVYLPFLDWHPIRSERSAQPPYLLERVPGSSDRYLLAARPDRRRGEPDPIYQWLHRLQMDRRWGEAKRLFYVAVTRARSKLLLSGVLPWQGKNGGPSLPSQTPLSWLDTHYELKESLELAGYEKPEDESEPDPGKWEKEWRPRSEDFRVLVEPKTLEPAFDPSADPPAVAICPAPFERENPILRIRHPSAFVKEGQDLEPGENPGGQSPPDDGPELTTALASFLDSREESRLESAGNFKSIGSAASRLTGTLIHRLFDYYAGAGSLPSLEKASAFLRKEGMGQKEAEVAAGAALAEVLACIEDPWLKRFYELPRERRWTEWPLEALHTPRTLYVGQVDLIAFFEEKWWLIDFKTSGPSPGEDTELFCKKSLARYRPQLLAYREMFSKVKGLEKEDEVEAVIYWTPLRHYRRLG